MSINILIVTSNYPPLTAAGGSIYFETLVKGLQRINGLKKIVILTEFAKGIPLVNTEGTSRVFRILFPKGKKQRSQRWGFGMRLFTFIINNILLLLYIPVLTLVYRVDIIHIHCSLFKIQKNLHFPNLLVYSLLMGAKKAFGTKVIVDVRGPGCTYNFYNRFDKIICASQNTYDSAIQQGLDKGKCLLVSIPFERPIVHIGLSDKERLKQLQPYVCFVGRIERSKGVYELIDAFQMLSTKLPGYNLVLIGTNEDKHLLRKIKKCKKIYYLGPKSHAETIKIISQAELLVLPSKSEGLPRVCLEAMSLGTKVLLPPGIPEFSQHCKNFQLNHVEPSEIRLKMYNLLCSSDKAFYPFEKHDPIKIAKSVISIYHEII